MRSVSSVPALVIGLCITLLPAATQAAVTPAEAKRTISLPIVFEENRGQFQPSTRYAVRSSGGLISFHEDGLEFLSGKSPNPARITLHPEAPSRDTKLVPEDLTKGKVNYFTGPTATASFKGISTYNRVRYSNFMPGVDLAFYGNGDDLEHDFIVEPQIDPRSVRFRITGAASLKVDADGALRIVTPESQLLFRKPVGYQLIAGRRVVVDVAFAVAPGGHVSFQVGQYDPTVELVIDPVLVFSTYLDGTHQDTATSVTTDSKGNVYVAGYTASSDFPNVNAYQTACGTCTGGYWGDAGFISKLDPTGTTLLYSTYFIGNGRSEVFRLKTDSADNLVGVGYTESTSFPKTGKFAPSYSYGTFVFLSILPAQSSITQKSSDRARMPLSLSTHSAISTRMVWRSTATITSTSQMRCH